MDQAVEHDIALPQSDVVPALDAQPSGITVSAVLGGALGVYPNISIQT